MIILNSSFVGFPSMPPDHRKQIDNLKKFSVDFRVSSVLLLYYLCILCFTGYQRTTPLLHFFSCSPAQIQILGLSQWWQSLHGTLERNLRSHPVIRAWLNQQDPKFAQSLLAVKRCQRLWVQTLAGVNLALLLLLPHPLLPARSKNVYLMWRLRVSRLPHPLLWNQMIKRTRKTLYQSKLLRLPHRCYKGKSGMQSLKKGAEPLIS